MEGAQGLVCINCSERNSQRSFQARCCDGVCKTRLEVAGNRSSRSTRQFGVREGGRPVGKGVGDGFDGSRTTGRSSKGFLENDGVAGKGKSGSEGVK